MQTTLTLSTPAETDALGGVIAPHLGAPCVCFFSGELGAGKTSLIRAILRAKKIQGAIKSPSYTLIEPYEIGHDVLYHMDLYRLASVDELEFLGIRDYFHAGSICLIEWPERGAESLPKPDLVFALSYHGEGRAITLSANTVLGQSRLEKIMKDYERDQKNN